MFGLARALVRAPLTGTIRARVVALALIAVIPAVVMAGIIAGQDFRSRDRIAIERVERMQALTVARFEVATGSIAGGLAAMAAGLDGRADCGQDFGNTLRHSVSRGAAVALYAADGALLCYDGGPSVLQSAAVGGDAWFRAAKARRWSRAVIGVTAADRSIVVAAGTRSGRVLAAVLPPDWLADDGPPGSAIWLVDDAGQFIAASGASGAALGPLATMAALQRDVGGARLSLSAGGDPYAYASTRLENGWWIIAAYQARAEHAKALSSLYKWLLELAALLLLGIAVTVLGADIAFGGPLRRLRTALVAWESGAKFDPGGLASAPGELVELANSFAQATVHLREQEAELARAGARQELLMLEVHHRVKNNLQIVASLLNLQASRIRVPEARAEFQSARDRVRALATLHRHLYSEGDIHTINMRSFLEELCGQLFQAMGETRGERIALSIEAVEVRLSTDQAVPLALIVTEAVTNAIKYAFPGGRRGTIAIFLSEADGMLDLVITDDGIGMPPGPTETESGIRDGIGLPLIRGFSRQLGAAFEIGPGPGTHYIVRLPLVAPSEPGEIDERG